MEDIQTPVGLLERPAVLISDAGAPPPPTPPRAWRRRGLFLAGAVAMSVVLAAPVTGRIAELVSFGTDEAVVDPVIPAFPGEETSRRALLSVFERVESDVAEALAQAEAAVDEARRQPEKAAASNQAGGSTVSQVTGSARASSSVSSHVDVSTSVSGNGSVSSSVSVSNSSSSSASAGGSVAVSGSSSSEVSSRQEGDATVANCYREAFSSSEVNGVVETARQVSRSC